MFGFAIPPGLRKATVPKTDGSRGVTVEGGPVQIVGPRQGRAFLLLRIVATVAGTTVDFFDDAGNVTFQTVCDGTGFALLLDEKQGCEAGWKIGSPTGAALSWFYHEVYDV